MLRVAAVGYLNARPLTCGLDDEARFEMSHGRPADAAEALVDGRADLALVPAITLLKGDFLTVPGLGIAADGPVDSVFLYRTREGEAEGTFRLSLDPASRTSQVLARIVLEDFLGVDTSRIVAREHEPATALKAKGEFDAVLVIGDQAMDLEVSDEWERVDLAACWREHTGLPFVFAVWGARPDLLDEAPWITERLDRALAEAEADLDGFARREAPRHGVDPDVSVAYLRNRIIFRLGEREHAGLDEFLRRARLRRTPTTADGDTACST